MGLTYWTPAERSVGMYGAWSWAWEVDAAMCPAFLRRPRLRIGACGGGGVGHFWTRGVGFDRVESGGGTLAHLGAAAVAEVALGGPWWLGVDLAGAAPLVHQQFVFRDNGVQQVLFDAPVIHGRAGLFLVLRVPAGRFP